jgi:unspecific monooxygenase
MLLIVGGNETTRNLIGNMVRVLSDHPIIQERLRGDPSLIKPFIEECLRYYSPIQFLPHRVVKTDCDFGGKHLEGGAMVFVYLGSANRDEKKFDEPDTFNPTGRKTTTWLSEGGYTCVSARPSQDWRPKWH